MKRHICTGVDCFACKLRTLNLRNRTAFQPHYNHSAGGYVDTELALKDLFKRRAEENSLVTGTYHEYEMRDPAELARHTPYPQSDDILNDQARRLYDAAG